MLIHLRRVGHLSSSSWSCSASPTRWPGPGSARCCSRTRPTGRLTADGSTLIGQHWSGTKWFQGRPLGSCVFHRARREVAPRAVPAGPRSKTGRNGGGDNPLVANDIPGRPGVLNSGESGATNLGASLSTLKSSPADA